MINVAGASYKGPVRSENQDSYLIGSLVCGSGLSTHGFSEDSEFLAASGLLVAVADGMGGAAGGALASRTVLSALGAAYHRRVSAPCPREQVMDAIEESVAEAQQILAVRLAEVGLPASAGTTLTGAVFSADGSLVVFNIGDSRAVWVGASGHRQLTMDDTLVGPGLYEGRLDAQQALAMGDSRLTRAIDGEDTCGVTFSPEDAWRAGDRYAFGSDGWHGLGKGLPAEDVVAALRWGSSAADACSMMARKALLVDGSDNVTAVVVYCDGGPACLG